MQVGFIGLGHMGSGMAANLLAAGHALTVYNRSPDKADRSSARARISPRRRAMPRAARWSSPCSPTIMRSSKWCSTKSGILEALAPGAIHVSMSTISVALAERLAAAHREKGQEFVAAPVFGRPDARGRGKLFIVAAGKPAGGRDLPASVRCARAAHLRRFAGGAEGQSRQAQRQFPDRLGDRGSWARRSRW